MHCVHVNAYMRMCVTGLCRGLCSLYYSGTLSLIFLLTELFVTKVTLLLERHLSCSSKIHEFFFKQKNFIGNDHTINS